MNKKLVCISTHDQAEFHMDPLAQQTSLICDRTFGLLCQHFGALPAGMPAFYSVCRSNRLILVFNPNLVGNHQLPDAFLQRLAVNLNGRRLFQLRRHGKTFLQVSYWPSDGSTTQRQTRLESITLELDKQPSPVHVPIGSTRSGPLWLNILEIDSALIGGARRMGKTTVLHAWIQALQHGAQVDLILWDGKGGVEFARYSTHPFTVVAAELTAVLARLQEEVLRRQKLFAERGVTSLAQYNALPGITPLRPLVLILDELADLPPEAESALITLVRRAGAYGVHPIVGIQRPDAEVLRGQLRANLVTRIALPVVTPADSRIILNRVGADRLPKAKGRLLLVWDGELIEAQAFRVNLPGMGQVSGAIPLLSEAERRLVQFALQSDGWFKIMELTTAIKEAGFEVSRDWVNETARRWETLGLLTTIQTDSLGRRLGRRVTPELVQACRLGAGNGGMAELAEKADLGDEDTE